MSSVIHALSHLPLKAVFFDEAQKLRHLDSGN